MHTGRATLPAGIARRTASNRTIVRVGSGVVAGPRRWDLRRFEPYSRGGKVACNDVNCAPPGCGTSLSPRRRGRGRGLEVAQCRGLLTAIPSRPKATGDLRSTIRRGQRPAPSAANSELVKSIWTDHECGFADYWGGEGALGVKLPALRTTRPRSQSTSRHLPDSDQSGQRSKCRVRS